MRLVELEQLGHADEGPHVREGGEPGSGLGGLENVGGREEPEQLCHGDESGRGGSDPG